MINDKRNDRRISIDSYARHSINVGGLEISFQRTVRVPEGRMNSLPAGLGNFPVYKVSDFKGNVPDHWNEDSFFMPMYPQEAMWMNFRGNYGDPKALIVAAGNINALTGKPFDKSLDLESRQGNSSLEIKLEKEQNYIVAPPQPWLDGWKSEDGKVYQFVAAEMGSGETVEGQLTGEEKVGGIQLVVYKAKPGKINHTTPSPREHPYPWNPTSNPWPNPWDPFIGYNKGSPWTWNNCFPDGISFDCNHGPKMMRAMSAYHVQDMGLGKGGEIHQKVYDDPYGLKVWDKKAVAAERIYLVSSYDFRQITGHNPPQTPVNYEMYQRLGYPWFEVWDHHLKDSTGTDKFDNLDTVSGGQTHKPGYPEIFEKFED